MEISRRREDNLKKKMNIKKRKTKKSKFYLQNIFIKSLRKKIIKR